MGSEAKLPIILALFAFLTVGASPSSQSGEVCPVTIPNSVIAPGSLNFGTAQISVALFRDGTVTFKPGGPGFVDPDGALGMKFPWNRGVAGRLTIDGHRIDAPAAPLRAEIPDGYGDKGFQSTALIFPTPGCWEVTGQVGDAKVTFVTEVVKVGDGPSWHRGAN